MVTGNYFVSFGIILRFASSPPVCLLLHLAVPTSIGDHYILLSKQCELRSWLYPFTLCVTVGSSLSTGVPLRIVAATSVGLCSSSDRTGL